MLKMLFHGVVFLSIVAQCLSKYRYVSQCIEPGVKCADCENLIFCVGTGAHNTPQQINLKACNNSDGLYCSVEHGGCATDHRVCDIFGLEDIQCQDTGLFPDPFDCTSYHECVSVDGVLKDNKYTCKVGLAYDPLSTICRLKKTDRVCMESPVPACLKPLQMGALVENPTIYYICVESEKGIYPRLYRCPNGLLFNVETSECVESLPATTTAPKVEFKCSDPGVFPDPDDCHKYYVCSNDLTAHHKTCRSGFYFDKKLKLCTLGVC